MANIPDRRPNTLFPKHMLSFSGFTVAVNLQTQGSGVPQKPATKLVISNISSDPDATGLVTIKTAGGQTSQVISVPPLSMSPPLTGQFIELTSRGGTGAAGLSVLAFWAD